MALEPLDWKVTRSTGAIEYIGADHDGTAGSNGRTTPTYATVIEFHRWLQGLADDAVAAGDDQLDITNTIPSQRSTDNIITLINGYDIDDTAAEHLYDGSVIQAGGAQIYDGIVNFGNADVQIQIIQNGAVLADDWWNYNGAGLNADATSGISHRFMIMTKSTTDIDGRKLIGTCRRFTKTYSEFTINATARGNNVLALNDSADLNNSTASGTVATWSVDFSNTEGYRPLDIDNNGTSEYYYSEWNIDKADRTINDFYEYTKYLTREGSTETLYGLSGELFRGITHDITVVQSTGTFVEPELLTWGSGGTAGTGQLLAANSTSAATHLYIQILTGAAPNGSITGATGVASVSSYIERTISKPFVGASTGSALIGSYGLGVVAADLSSSDSLTDLSANVLTPPNNVTNTLAGLVENEDRVLVAPRLGVDSNGDPAINKSQMTIATTALTTNNVTSIIVNAVPSYTPAPAGYLRVTDNNGYERRLHYSALDVTNKTFTIDTTDGNEDFGTVNADIGNNAYIAYIDDIATASGSLSFTSVHPTSAAAMDLVIIVRDGGEINTTPIKQYIAPWSQTDSNNTATAIRTSDL